MINPFHESGAARTSFENVANIRGHPLSLRLDYPLVILINVTILFLEKTTNRIATCSQSVEIFCVDMTWSVQVEFSVTSYTRGSWGAQCLCNSITSVVGGIPFK